MTTKKFTPYEGGHVYILDCPGAGSTSKFEAIHNQKNEHMGRVFRNHTDYKVHNVTFQSRSKPEAVLEYFITELEERKKKNEIVIIYFHGGAGGNGEDYVW